MPLHQFFARRTSANANKPALERCAMRTPAKPKVNLYVQVPPEISELRCRLQERTGFSSSRLVSEALLALAKRLGVAAAPDKSAA
jgi:hypothetical protein